MKKELRIEGYDIDIRRPEHPTDTVIYYIGGNESAEEVLELIPSPVPAVVFVTVRDWNCDLSPWPAERVFRGGEGFGGGADRFLNILTNSIAPAVEKETGSYPKRGIAGYSLAGLLAVYAAYRTDFFDRIGSFSGSLWFDRFVDFAESHEFSRIPEKMYFSLGANEKISKNERMSQVQVCTERLCGKYRAMGIGCELRLQPGGHFNDVNNRIAEGLSALAD